MNNTSIRDIVEKCDGGVLIRIFVKPGSPRLSFPAGIEDGFVILEVRSPPLAGKANRELVKSVAKFFGVSSSNVSIIGGIKDRNKIVRVLGVTVESAKRELGI